MKSLSEYIARRANAEDNITGRFWEGRFKCQALLSEKAILAAMTYVDLNPVRANIATGVSSSRYTSVKVRNRQIQQNAEEANKALRPLDGTRSCNIPAITEAEYIELVDFTGRHWHAGKKAAFRSVSRKRLPNWVWIRITGRLASKALAQATGVWSAKWKSWSTKPKRSLNARCSGRDLRGF
jgi:hypothetical protein